ncbi:unnamed protein product [Thlaspi arvense]|uniref:RNase H type-1 domain-containing protein n=1 Tax=Thlaspi arvense TaxID=13288 RepID=A0AAU9RWE7_THLAR|nr:unnamed protein product [Thlaspi arvense]
MENSPPKAYPIDHGAKPDNHYESYIRKLIPSTFHMRDEFSWLPKKSGVYSTKSGYTLRSTRSGPRMFPSTGTNVKTSPNLKTFLWKLKNRALHVGETLAMRGITVDSSCKKCGAIKNESHILLHCSFSVRVWDSIPALHKPPPSTPTFISDLLQSCRCMINLPQVGFSSTPFYPWSYTAEEVARKSIRIDKTRVAPLPIRSRYQKKSFPSDINCFVDAAWNPTSGICGLGWIFKTGSEALLRQNSACRSCVDSAFVAEGLRLKSALLDAVSSGIRALNCFSDSKNHITLLTGNGNTVEIQRILHDIRVLSSFFDSICFSFVLRLNNVSADLVATEAFAQAQTTPFVEM